MKKIVLSLDFNPAFIFKLIGVLTGITILLSVISLFLNYSSIQHDLFGLMPKFDMDKENTIPTYVSSFNLLVAAFTLAIIACVVKRRDGAHSKNWGILSGLFFLLSLDESASLHEGVASRFNIMMGGFTGTTHYAWAILGSGFILAFLIYFSRFIFALPAATRNRFIVSGIIFLTGAIGTEAFGGLIYSQSGTDNLAYQASVIVEESLEMLGIYCFIWSLFRYVGENLVRRKSAPESPALRLLPLEEENYSQLVQESA